jgi:hypothetical protein
VRSVRGKTVEASTSSTPQSSVSCALQRPAFNIAGIRRPHLLFLSSTTSRRPPSRQLTRLRYLGLIKRIIGTYRYYLTRIGRSALAACCRLAEHTIIPALA